MSRGVGRRAVAIAVLAVLTLGAQDVAAQACLGNGASEENTEHPHTPDRGGELHMIDAPRITQADAQPAAVIHLTIPREEIQSVMGPAIQEVMAAVAAQDAGPAGPVFAHHLRMDPDTFDFEVGVPVSEPVSSSGRVESSELPAATVVRTVYRGPYEGLADAWAEFNAWIEDHGYTAAPNLWECYVAGPESDPDPANWRTELNRPLVD